MPVIRKLKALTPEQMESLQAVKATGAAEIEFADRRVRYRDLNELNSIIAESEAAGGVNPDGTVNANSKFKRQYLSVTSKGL